VGKTANRQVGRASKAKTGRQLGLSLVRRRGGGRKRESEGQVWDAEKSEPEQEGERVRASPSRIQVLGVGVPKGRGCKVGYSAQGVLRGKAGAGKGIQNGGELGGGVRGRCFDGMSVKRGSTHWSWRLGVWTSHLERQGEGQRDRTREEPNYVQVTGEK